MIFRYLPGQTPIDAAEADELIPPLTTQAELNAWEEQNIVRARQWALSKRVLQASEPLSEDYFFKLHVKMFGDTWRWAGHVRTRDKNIGVSFPTIRVQLKEFLDDARYWREHFDFDEFGFRLITA